MHDEGFQMPQTASWTRNIDLVAAPIDPGAGIEPIAIPFGRMLSMLRRHLWIVLLTFVLGVGGATMVVKHMPKQFTAQALLIIEPQRTQVSDLQAISDDGDDVGSLMHTQIGILSSPALALGIVNALDLTKDPEFIPSGGGLRANVQAWLVDHHLKAKPEVIPLTPDEKTDIAAAILGGKLAFSNDPESRLLGISVTTLNPVLSARIANEVASQFLAFKVQEKFAAMQRAHDWLQRQVVSFSVQGRADEAAVEA